jgi:hypothetical protein
MSRLLHYCAKPTAFDLQREYPAGLRADKPHGLWLSVEGKDDWESWCRDAEFELDSLALKYELVLRPDANILRIGSLYQLDDFDHEFGTGDRDRHVSGIDWTTVRSRWDGIIISPYLWGRRLELMWYYGWDCASGVIWNLRSVEAIRPATAADALRAIQ